MMRELHVVNLAIDMVLELFKEAMSPMALDKYGSMTSPVLEVSKI